MQCRLSDPLLWLYPDTLNSIPAVSSFCVDIARGGLASVNAVLFGLKPGKTVTIRCESGSDVGLPDGELVCFRLIEVNVERNTGRDSFTETTVGENPFVTRRAPFQVYDALCPAGVEFPASSECVALYVQFRTAHAVAPGTYVLNLVFDCGGESCSAQLTVRIANTILPEPERSGVFYTNWFWSKMAAEEAGVKLWSEDFWSILAGHAAMMHHARQNMFLMLQRDFFTYDEAADRIVFHAARFRRYAEVFFRAGLRYIEGGHFGERTTGEWLCPTFRLSLTHHPADSMEANCDIAEIAGVLNREIHRNGWEKRYFQHVADEPIPQNAASFRILAGVVRKYMPDLPLLDAMSDPEIAGAVDIWCPQVQMYQARRADFDATRKQGDHLWCYTCCCPGGKFLNRLMDGELMRPLLLGWGCARWGLEGFLHWGWNYRKPGQDPFKENTPEHGGGGNRLPPGDTHIVYQCGREVWPSMRLEAQREGLEDWCLLRRLSRRNAAKSDALASVLFRAFDDYSTDPALLRKTRKALLDELEKS